MSMLKAETRHIVMSGLWTHHCPARTQSVENEYLHLCVRVQCSVPGRQDRDAVSRLVLSVMMPGAQ